MGNIYHTNWIYNYFKEKYGWKKELILKNIDETINYFIEKINQFDLISKKHKKVCTAFNYVEYLYYVTYFSFCGYWMWFHFCFASLVGIPICIGIFAVGLNPTIKSYKKKQRSMRK